MNKIRPGFILPSGAFTIKPQQVKNYERLDRTPAVGDVLYGRVSYVGQHSSLENKEGAPELASCNCGDC